MFRLLATTVAAVYIASRILVFLKARKNANQIPQRFTLFEPLTPLGATIPTSWWNFGLAFTHRDRHTQYQNAPLGAITVTPLIQGGKLVYTRNLQAFRQVLGTNSAFFKPTRATNSFDLFGPNVVASSGELWKRHRRITAPAFNHTTYKSVWDTTVNAYEDFIQKDGWKDTNTAAVPDINKITHKLALLVVSICSFGMPMAWSSPTRDADGHLSLRAIIFEVATTVLPRWMVPGWIYAFRAWLPKLAVMEEAWADFERVMKEQIVVREGQLQRARADAAAGDSGATDGIKDVFGRLVNARLTDGKLSLTDEEIISNSFIMMFAGHETTATTLATTIALLGLYPETQEWVCTSIKDAIGDREPVFEDFDKLDGVLACFLEGLRLFPAAYLIIREAARDAVLSLPRIDNPNVVEQVHFPKGEMIVLDLIGIFNDPTAFPNPDRFDPNRWTRKSSVKTETATLDATQAEEISTTDSALSLEGFIGFSFGPRTCLGHKFAKVEAVAFLTFLLRDWRIEIVLKEGETKEAWRRRVLAPKFEPSLTVGTVPVTFVRRSGAP